MQPGVIGVLDALGFKGIWAAHDPQAVVATLRETMSLGERVIESHLGIQRRAEDRFGHSAEDLRGDHRIIFLSDTIVIAYTPSEPLTKAMHYGVRMVVAAAAQIACAAAMSDPPLVYRGCITDGNLLIDEPFLIGEAVDKAADGEKKADGAFIYLDRQSRELFDLVPVSEGGASGVVRNCRVPLRDGRSLKSHVVNPLEPARKEDRKTVADSILGFMRESAATDPSVGRKLENTEFFLQRAMAQAIEYP